MIKKLFTIILILFPLNLLASEQGASDRFEIFKERLGLDKEYWIDKAIDKGVDTVYSWTRPMLEKIPFIGGYFSLNKEKLKVAKDTLEKVRNLAKEARRTTQHLNSLYRFGREQKESVKSIYEAWKKGGGKEALLSLSEDMLGFSVNPGDYIPDMIGGDKIRRKWRRATSRGISLKARTNLFLEMNRRKVRDFTTRAQISERLEQLIILEKQIEYTGKNLRFLNRELERAVGHQKQGALKKEIEAFTEKRKSFLAQQTKVLKDLNSLNEDSAEVAFANKMEQFYNEQMEILEKHRRKKFETYHAVPRTRNFLI